MGHGDEAKETEGLGRGRGGPGWDGRHQYPTLSQGGLRAQKVVAVGVIDLCMCACLPQCASVRVRVESGLCV